MKKHLCLLLAAVLLAAILLFGGLAGCGMQRPGASSGGEGAASSGESASSGVTSEPPDSEGGAGSNLADSAETQRYQIADDVYITPIKADKPLEQLSDDDMTQMAAKLFEQANLIWQYLFAGIDDMAVDQTDSIAYDGDEWYPLKYIHSFAGYQTIVDSVFAKGFYSDHVFQFIKECMMEQNSKLYLCKNRFGGVPADIGIEADGVEMVRKEADGIQVYVRMKDVDPDHASYPDTLTRYMLLRQDGDWVLQSFRGETTGLDFLKPLQPPFPAPSGSADLSIPADTKTAVPDFLDAQQQELYRKAYNFAPVFLFDSSAVEVDSDNQPMNVLDGVEINGDQRFKSEGRFHNTGDFVAASLSLFTPDYFESLTKNNFWDGNGTLYFQLGGWGSDPFYAFREIPDTFWLFRQDEGETPNTFRLVHKDENRLEFMLIGHYYILTNGQSLKDITEMAPQDRKTTTQEAPIVMVNTPDGWRFSEFHIPPTASGPGRD